MTQQEKEEFIQLEIMIFMALSTNMQKYIALNIDSASTDEYLKRREDLVLENNCWYEAHRPLLTRYEDLMQKLVQLRVDEMRQS